MSSELGQFYTDRCNYILKGLYIPEGVSRVIEPFAGKGDLVVWTKRYPHVGEVEMYDIEPKMKGIVLRDTLMNPPNYEGKWVITNPPYLARNKANDKRIFEKYKTNDLYKCFIYTLCEGKGCEGGIIIIPSGFFFSPRPIDVKCRDLFMRKYTILEVKYFEESVFDDTTTTVVAIQFEKAKNEREVQEVLWRRLPLNETRTFSVSAKNRWIVGGELYEEVKSDVKITRYVEGKDTTEDTQITNMCLRALDSGNANGRIGLEFKEGYVFRAKESDRTYATLCVRGVRLTRDEQIEICKRFNLFIENKRQLLWSLFLPQYRESKEYARKRIPFDLAYNLVKKIIVSK